MRSRVKLPTSVHPSGLPQLVMYVDGQTEVTVSTLQAAEWVRQGAHGVRKFKSHALSRSTPQRPYLGGNVGRHVDVESGLEATVASLLARDLDVKALVAQPFWIGPPWSCPDFAIVTRDGTLIAVEAKTRWNLRAADARRRLALTESRLQALGIPYELWLDLPDDKQRVFELLDNYRRWQPQWGRPDGALRVLADELIEVARTTTGCTLGDLVSSELAPASRLRALVWHLCWAGELCIDWQTQPFLKSLVRAHGEQCTPTLATRTPGRAPMVCGPEGTTLRDAVRATDA